MKEINNLGDILKKVFVKLTRYEGEVLWCLLSNAELEYKGKDYSGTFRYNGDCISKIVPGTDYLDFYCSNHFVDMNSEEYIKTAEMLLTKLKNFGCKWKGEDDRFNHIYLLNLKTGKSKRIE
jgi:uncharacterized iron-regulated protein